LTLCVGERDFLQCFDAVGWLTVRNTAGKMQSLIPLSNIQHGTKSVGTEEEHWKGLADPGSPRKMAIRWRLVNGH